MDDLSLAVHKVAGLGDHRNVMLYVAIPFYVLALIAFVLRVYVRAYMLRAFGKDDWAMAVTLAIYTTSVGLLMTVYALESNGRPQRVVKEGDLLGQYAMLDQLMGYIIAGMFTYIISTVTLKISLAIFFLRVVFEVWQRRVIYIVTSIYTIFGIGFAFIAVFQCGDPHGFLLKEYTGECIGNDIMQPLNYVHGALNAASDWVFALLPIALLWQSSLPRSAKISAGLLLSLGGLGSISSLIRMKYIPGLKSGPNFFTNAVDTGIWSILEPGLGIIAASLATLRPLFRSMMERTGARSNENSENSTEDSNSPRKAAPVSPGFPGKGYVQMEDKPAHSVGTVARDMKSPAYELRALSPLEEDFPVSKRRDSSGLNTFGSGDDTDTFVHAAQFNTTAPLANKNDVDHGHTINATAPLPNSNRYSNNDQDFVSDTVVQARTTDKAIHARSLKNQVSSPYGQQVLKTRDIDMYDEEACESRRRGGS